MLIEYKIKFEKDGLTIAQHIEPNSAPAAPPKATVSGLPAAQQELGPVASNPLVTAAGPIDKPGGGGPVDKPGGGGPIDKPGGGGFGTAPIFILGPIVFSNAAPESKETTEPPKPVHPPKAHGTAAGK
jgi:hypothetical protein